MRERIQGASRLLTKTAASLGEHAQGLAAIAKQFPAASKRLQTAVDLLQRIQDELGSAATDIVRESQAGDQAPAPPVMA